MKTLSIYTANEYTNRFISTLFIVVTACFAYKGLEIISLKHSAALFIGIPLLMGTLLAATSNTKNITLHIITGMTLGLVASFLYLNEGSFCVPMTAPLFLITALTISYSFTKLKHYQYKKHIYILPLILMLMLSLEGISPTFSFNRFETVQISKETSLSPVEINQALSESRQFNTIPTLLSWGFPQPLTVTGKGDKTGNIRDIYFSGGEGEAGHAIFEITKRNKSYIEFSLLKDDSHISHWLEWKKSKVSWTEIEPGKTIITWSLEYKRHLDPSWYFGPLQKYAVQLSANALIDNLILNQ